MRQEHSLIRLSVWRFFFRILLLYFHSFSSVIYIHRLVCTQPRECMFVRRPSSVHFTSRHHSREYFFFFLLIHFQRYFLSCAFPFSLRIALFSFVFLSFCFRRSCFTCPDCLVRILLSHLRHDSSLLPFVDIEVENNN